MLQLECLLAYQVERGWEHGLIAGQWDKQAQSYQAWSKAPQTADMHLIAQGLGAPQIQEKLVTALQQLQQQSQQAPGQQKGDRGQGLSI